MPGDNRPASSAARLGDTVTIKGSNFIVGAPGLHEVHIGDVIVPVIDVADAGTLRFKVPKGTGGQVTVKVNGASNCNPSTLVLTYYYTVTTVDLFAGTPMINNCVNVTDNCLSYPTGIDIDGEENLIVADRLNSVIRKISSSGAITATYGKFKVAGCNATTVPIAGNASFSGPYDIDVDPSGDIYVAEEVNNAIRILKKNRPGRGAYW